MQDRSRARRRTPRVDHLRRYLARREPTTVGLTQPDHRIQRRNLSIHRLVPDVDRNEENRLRRVGQATHRRARAGGRQRDPGVESGASDAQVQLPTSRIEDEELATAIGVHVKHPRAQHESPRLGVVDRRRQGGAHYHAAERLVDRMCRGCHALSTSAREAEQGCLGPVRQAVGRRR
jgi:hypothetical protein